MPQYFLTVQIFIGPMTDLVIDAGCKYILYEEKEIFHVTKNLKAAESLVRIFNQTYPPIISKYGTCAFDIIQGSDLEQRVIYLKKIASLKSLLAKCPNVPLPEGATEEQKSEWIHRIMLAGIMRDAMETEKILLAELDDSNKGSDEKWLTVTQAAGQLMDDGIKDPQGRVLTINKARSLVSTAATRRQFNAVGAGRRRLIEPGSFALWRVKQQHKEHCKMMRNGME